MDKYYGETKLRTRQKNNVLQPTPGGPWGVEQHHWNTAAKENQQLNRWTQQQTKKTPAPTN